MQTRSRANQEMMTSTTAKTIEPVPAWQKVAAIGDAEGSAAHPHLHRLLTGLPAQRNLSDAVHALCAVHGAHPGMADTTLAHHASGAVRSWLEAVVHGFAAERAYLANLTAAVGPTPSTPGQAETEAALAGERRAIDTLAGSDRAGCAPGAIAALVRDWSAIRRVLDVAANRFGIDIAAMVLPTDEDSAAALAELATSPGRDRAIAFGAQQLFAQHRGLWTLLEARASARGDL